MYTYVYNDHIMNLQDHIIACANIKFKNNLSRLLRMFNVNVKSVINVTKLVSNKMIAAGKKGAIVNVSSVVSYLPNSMQRLIKI